MQRKVFIILILLILAIVSQAWCTSPLVERILGSRKVISTLYFSDNSYLIDADGRMQLEMLVDVLQEEIAKGRFIRAEGFASNEGRDIYSFKLSLQRAKSVIDFYNSLGNLPEIYMTGYGDLKDQGNNPSNEWRVEIASYENLVDVRLVKKKSTYPMIAQPTYDPRPITTIATGQNVAPIAANLAHPQVSPIDNLSLREFKQGQMITTTDTGLDVAPLTTIKTGEDVAPLTTIKTGEDVAPLTTIKTGEEAAPLALAEPNIDTSPISIPSLRDFMLGSMNGFAKLDEPLIIDALAIDHALREKLMTPSAKPIGTITQVDAAEKSLNN